jgi:hypothetical protein
MDKDIEGYFKHSIFERAALRTLRELQGIHREQAALVNGSLDGQLIGFVQSQGYSRPAAEERVKQDPGEAATLDYPRLTEPVLPAHWLPIFNEFDKELDEEFRQQSGWAEGASNTRIADSVQAFLARTPLPQPPQATGNPQLQSERQELNVSPESLVASFEEKAEGQQPQGSTSKSVTRGQICVQVKEEMRRFRYMALEGGRSIKDIMAATPKFKIWEIAENLATEDRDTLLHPNQWGGAYSTLLVAKHFGVSKVTIRDYITAYNKSRKKSPSSIENH